MSSKTVDQRVVEMRFDNRQFEQGVSTSMSTLDKLKKALRFDGATKGLDDISAAAKGIDFTPLSGAVENVKRGFSALEVIGVTALANITNSAVNTGKQLVKSLTIDQVTSGWDKFEKKTASVQTLVNSTGLSNDRIETYLNKLMWYSDETSYGFADMTQALATMVSSGGDIEKLISMIEGVANATSFAGKGASEFSRVMQYSINQAYSLGHMQAQDWKTIEGATVNSKQLIQTLIAAGEELGKIEKGQVTIESFRGSLKDKWLDKDVMEKGFGEFSKVTEEIYKGIQDGTFENYADGLAKIGDKYGEVALRAAASSQEAKSFTEAIDATKDAVSSGWMTTFERIFGSYEEQRVLWTDLSNALWEVFASGAKARNDLLNDWKELGGRDLLIESLWNTWNSIFGSIDEDGNKTIGILTAIKTAFREIFPAATADDLYAFTEKVRDLTEKFKMSDETAENLKNTFKGFFAILSMIKQGISAVLKGLTPLGGAFHTLSGSVLEVTGGIGEWLTELDKALQSGDGLAKVTEGISKAISKVIEFIGNFVGGITSAGEVTDKFGNSVGNAAKSLSELGAKSKVLEFLKSVGEMLGKITSSIATLAKQGFGKLVELFSKIDFGKVGEMIDTLSFSALTAGIIKFISYLRKPLKELGSIKKSVIGVIDAVGGRFSAMEKSLFTIAAAVGILAASLLLLSAIDERQLGSSLAVITVLFAELASSLVLLGRTSSIRGMGSMVLISTSVLILVSALKKISDLNLEELITGITGISGAMLMLFAAVSNMPKDIAGKGGPLLLLAISLQVLASAMKSFGKMGFEQVITSFVVLGGSLMLIANAMRMMPPNMAATGAGLLIVSTALGILALSLRGLGSMSWESMAKSLITLGAALAIFAVGLKLMTGTVAGSASLIIAATALAIMAPALVVIGSMPIASIGKALLVLASSFAILGIAGAVLAPVVPVILGLAGAMALIGLAVLGVGAGLLAAGAGLSALAVGITALAGIGVGAAASIASSIAIIGMALISLIPFIIEKIGEGVVKFCVAIGNGAQAIGEAFRKVLVVIVDVVLTTLVEYTPRMVDLLFDFLIAVLNGLANRMPEFIDSVINLVGSFLRGIGDAIRAIDTETMLQDLGIITLITGLIAGLSVIGPMIPNAMIALIGVAAFIAELSLVLAAIGALNQIPGLNWLIGEGGKLLESVGTAIGGFVGGIVGGFMSGVSSQFPKIGKDLADFMTNVEPFIEGAKTIDSRVLKGVADLSAAILIITGADILSGIASWLSGKSSLSSFADELVPFGQSMKDYSVVVAGIDSSVVSASANAAKALVELSNNLPKQGGVVSWFSGKSDMASFGENLVSFGECFSEYALKIQNVDTNVVSATSNATRAIVEISNAIPKTGLFSGNTSISGFGGQLSSFGFYFNGYYNYVKGIDTAVLSSVVKEMDNLVRMAKGMADIDSGKLSGFGTSLAKLGSTGLDGFLNAFTGATNKIQDAAYSLTDKFLVSASAKKMSFYSAFKKLAEECVNGLRSEYNNFYSAGEYLVRGFADGVSANTYLAEARAKLMASMAAKAAERELDINSPSKVGWRIGDFFGLGFVNAIDAYQKRAYESSAGMAESAQSGLTAAASKIQDAIEGNLDSQPVIRPVLDLSNIQAGSRYLDGLIPSGGIHTIRGAELSSRISTGFGSEGSVNPRIQNATPASVFNATNTFNIYGTNAQEIAQKVSKILNNQVQRRERAWA